ncbi:amidase [Pseudomonas sp. B21-023]|uniref:amidase n=1 Tax=Pseudomonas sp. B21-023 TaxID=2895477 RepID=UPI00215FDC24|nr:amidase [Pseudomonas sp. B21-023]UVM14763.1 amidase [Pseudomonas sp. B21-023]
MDILGCDANTLSEAVKRGAIRPTQVLDAYFRQVDKVNPQINALVQSNRAMAYEQAAWIERNLPRLQHKRLLGVPFSVKNTCHALGYSPDKGCAGLAGQPSEADATVVARLRGEGALLLGLTNTPELSIGYETDNLLYGQTRNPHDLSRSPGGSSGGEAALIAAGGSLLGIGSDASGSLRVPAHNSGICTLRLTQGRVPLTGHFPLDCMGMFSPFISFGPMARSIADLRLAAPLLAGPDGRDPHVAPVPWQTAPVQALASLRVAWYADDGIAPAEADVRQAVGRAADALRGEVARLDERRPEVLGQIQQLLADSVLLGGDEGQWLTDLIQQLNLREISPLLREYHALTRRSRLTVTQLRGIWMQLDRCRQAMLRFLDDYDVIICPVAATVAKGHGRSYAEVGDFSYSICYSLVNWPVAVVPVGQSRDGLPIGVQVIARPWREDLALQVAGHLEQLAGWRLPALARGA